MKVLEISHNSLEYIRWPASATNAAGGAIDPSAFAVTFAFTTTDDPPAANAYVNGSWAVTATGQHRAQCLIGPTGAFAPTANTRYFVWIKVQGNPEVPERMVGILDVV